MFSPVLPPQPSLSVPVHTHSHNATLLNYWRGVLKKELKPEYHVVSPE